MKKKELKELRTKDVKELVTKADSLRLEISKTSAQMRTSKEKNLKKVKNSKKDLAQVLTIVKEKEISEAEKRKGEK